MASPTVEVRIVDADLMQAVVEKIKTWDALCKCVDEFVDYKLSAACDELFNADDDAMHQLRIAAERTAGAIEMLKGRIR